MAPQLPQTKRGRLSSGGICKATGCAHSEQNFIKACGWLFKNDDRAGDALGVRMMRSTERIEVYHCRQQVYVTAVTLLSRRDDRKWKRSVLIPTRWQVANCCSKAISQSRLHSFDISRIIYFFRRGVEQSGSSSGS